MSKITYENKECIYENADIPDVNKVKSDDMNEIKAIVNQNVEVIGNETDTYSASSTYALGSLVIYNNLLYKCTTAITVAEAWNSAKWTQTSLTSEVNDGAIYSNNEIIIGKWIDGKPLYRKTIHIGAVNPSATTQSKAHNIANVDKIFIDLTHSYGEDSEGTFYQQTQWGKSLRMSWLANTTYIYYLNSWSSTIIDAYATVEYTKTTD